MVEPADLTMTFGPDPVSPDVRAARTARLVTHHDPAAHSTPTNDPARS